MSEHFVISTRTARKDVLDKRGPLSSGAFTVIIDTALFVAIAATYVGLVLGLCAFIVDPVARGQFLAPGLGFIGIFGSVFTWCGVAGAFWWDELVGRLHRKWTHRFNLKRFRKVSSDVWYHRQVTGVDGALRSLLAADPAVLSMSSSDVHELIGAYSRTVSVLENLDILTGELAKLRKVSATVPGTDEAVALGVRIQQLTEQIQQVTKQVDAALTDINVACQSGIKALAAAMESDMSSTKALELISARSAARKALDEFDAKSLVTVDSDLALDTKAITARAGESFDIYRDVYSTDPRKQSVR